MNRLFERFASPLDVDAYLAAVNPRWGTRLRGVVEEVIPRTATAASIVIRPGRTWRPHRAGQFVTVGIDVGGVRHQRCYSLTSPPGRSDGWIEITVQGVEGGTVSTHLVERTGRGDVVHLSQAQGDFVLPAAEDGGRGPDLLFISGGSGITPLIAMVRALASQRRDHPDVRVVHHATRPDHALFATELAELASTHPWLDVELVLTRHPDGTPRRGFRLDPGRLEALCPDWRDRRAFVCGPEAMLTFATDHWSANRILGRLHIERFTAGPAQGGAQGTAQGGAAGTGGTLLFARSGAESPSDGSTTLLDLAEAAGVAAPSGCRMGICHTCSTPLLAGCARDLRDGRRVEAGSHVQLCVSAAAGDVTLDL